MTDIEKTIDEARADTLPFESWGKLEGETSNAYAAFCVYRDLGAVRNIRRAVETAELDRGKCEKRYCVFRNWASLHRWKERAADFDRYLEQLKQAELRKTIEAQGEKHRQVTGRMLDVVLKKLDTMNPDDLSQGSVAEWVNTAIKSERDGVSLVSANGKPEPVQGELSFVQDFQGL